MIAFSTQAKFWQNTVQLQEQHDMDQSILQYLFSDDIPTRFELLTAALQGLIVFAAFITPFIYHSLTKARERKSYESRKASARVLLVSELRQLQHDAQDAISVIKAFISDGKRVDLEKVRLAFLNRQDSMFMADAPIFLSSPWRWHEFVNAEEAQKLAGLRFELWQWGRTRLTVEMVLAGGFDGFDLDHVRWCLEELEKAIESALEALSP